ncbi:hypothetical protein [Streptomyces indicus]|uniref:Secreted protein n=1 Tax=Streptomyces indicus TaxID=417292 RepID=A0A1G9ER82_9ACTN|nr:hypothetical protein [Streptomyces indicus]SDK78639.1 hypothetical protein SAMN05421806_11213 [Streptomyces indicus]
MSARSPFRRQRRGMAVAASAAVVCLGTLLAACGSGTSDDGYVAVGAAGSGPSERVEPVQPTEDVEFVPLDGEKGAEGTPSSGAQGKDGADSGKGGSGPGSASGGAGGSGGSGGSGGGSGSGAEPGGSEGESPGGSAGSGTGTSGAAGGSGGSGTSGGSGGGGSDSGGTSGSSGAAPGTGAPAGPAVLKVLGEPVRKATDRRWCEKVSVTFHNTGGSAVRSAEVTFGTHIIGALGVDWATIKSTEKVAAPIAAGAKKTQTWTVCVEAWRVPLGMRIETQDVSVKWQ